DFAVRSRLPRGHASYRPLAVPAEMAQHCRYELLIQYRAVTRAARSSGRVGKRSDFRAGTGVSPDDAVFPLRFFLSTTGGRLQLFAAVNGRCAAADPDKSANRLDELGHGNRLRQIGLTAALADALLVALHRKGSHSDHGNGFQFRVFLEPPGHF